MRFCANIEAHDTALLIDCQANTDIFPLFWSFYQIEALKWLNPSVANLLFAWTLPFLHFQLLYSCQASSAHLIWHCLSNRTYLTLHLDPITFSLKAIALKTSLYSSRHLNYAVECQCLKRLWIMVLGLELVTSFSLKCVLQSTSKLNCLLKWINASMHGQKCDFNS